MAMNFEDYHILVVDDDQRLRDLLARYLSENGYLVTAVASAEEADEHLSMVSFDLMILDVMMPGESGLEYAKRLIQSGSTLPILFLTAMSDTEDRIRGLEIGVDEYLPKPFEPKELLLRMRAILRRQKTIPVDKKNQNFYIGKWLFNIQKNTLKDNEKTVSLTSSEADILKFFLGRTGDVVSRDQILKHVGGASSARAIDIQITRLRQKLEDDARQPKHIQTIRNQGYILWV
jgi:two-component system phosphate regulon response regulator OmpR